MIKLLVLGASELQVPVIRRCAALGIYCIAADYDPSAPGLTVANESWVISTNDTDAILRAAAKNGINAILTNSDFPVRTVATVAKKLGLVGLPEEAAKVCTDKYLQRAILGSAGLLVPQYQLIDPVSDIPGVLPFEMPIIVKPTDNSASRGVSRVSDMNDLATAILFARENGRSKKVLIESFVTGREFSIEVLIQKKTANIVAITEKTTSGDNEAYFVEERHIIPARLLPEEESAIRGTVERAIMAGGMDQCAAHVELKLSPRGPVIIEMAARLGGDYITSDLVPLATGVDMIENIIRISLGQPVETRKTRKHHSGIQFITPNNYNIMKKRLSALSGNPNVIRTCIRPVPLKAVLRSSLDRLGYVIACAESRAELEETLRCE